MELVAITLARLTSLIQLSSWDPFGRTSTLEAIKTLASAFKFEVYPKSLPEINLAKGIEILEGKMGDIVIDKITVYANGIVIDTRSSTDNSETVLTAILDLIHKALGAQIKPARQTYTSQFNFRSEMNLLAMQPSIVKDIAEHLTERTSTDLKHPFTFQPTGLLFNADLSQARIPPTMFSIERLADMPFSENLYFSAAPLPTNEHIQVVEQFEASLLRLQSHV